MKNYVIRFYITTTSVGSQRKSAIKLLGILVESGNNDHSNADVKFYTVSAQGT
mgnify:CR=1 FL=1